jgi:hypothetical protein
MTVMVETLAFVADGTEVGGADLTDDELTDLVPLALYSSQSPGFLPMWYMPPVVARAAGGWRRPLVFVLIAAFLAIDGFGLCITYGQLVAA